VLASLNGVRDGLVAMVKDHGAGYAMQQFNNTLVINGIAPVIKQLYTEVGVRYAKMYYREMVKEPQQKAELPGLGFSQTWTNNIQAILQQFLTDKILFKTSETTKNLLLSIISQGIEAGWSVDKMVQELSDFPGLKYQAERIVRTEVGRASNIGIIESGKSFKFEQMKEWISIRDTRTRGFDPKDHANHLAMNGQRVDFDQPFIDPRNLDLLMQPGDPSAKAESTINCRCTMALVAKRDENGRLIPKRRANISVIMPGQIRPFTQTITI
jgi:uncharacterized protein with gpF-like domain